VEISHLAAALSALAPAGIVTGARLITANDLASLSPAERSLVDRAVPSRQAEFATGRELLRGLLGSRAEILVGPTRAPLLPPGVVASLAHDSAVAVAAVGRNAGLISLGIDVEPVTDLTDDEAGLILRRDESHIDPCLAFSLKEATYKAWSTAGGRLLEHHDVQLHVETDRFEACVVEDGRVFRGGYSRVADRYLALVVNVV
jgi:enterobactin synthetase component D